jgi:hypothetical protein
LRNSQNALYATRFTPGEPSICVELCAIFAMIAE